MPRYIDADLILPEMESKLDMQELYLPIHFQEFIVDEIPSADVSPVRHGRWEEQSDRDELVCSYCNGGYTLYDETPYCPHCGAKMDEEENENDR